MAFHKTGATLAAVAAGAGTTVPAELGEVPVNESEGVWSLARAEAVSPTLVTGDSTNSGTINIRQVRQNCLKTIPVSTGGAGYQTAPTVVISAPTGSSGALTQGQRQATAHAVLSAGAVSSIAIDDYGAGYTAAPTVSLSGGGYTTAATLGTPTVGQQVIGTLATLALVTGTNLPAEAPVSIPLSAALGSPILAGDVLDVQYVQIGTGLALVVGTKIEVELQ